MTVGEDFLRRITKDKRAEIRRRRAKISATEIKRRAAAAPPPRNFAKSLKNAAKCGRFPAIAEIKQKSPSKGILCADFNPAALAEEYESGGAACLSVLTDAPHFGGDEKDLQTARTACALPVLRKDFMLEEWQIYESRALGADAVLLIAAILPPETMAALANLAENLGMAVLGFRRAKRYCKCGKNDAKKLHFCGRFWHYRCLS
ncbi:MAG: indole-3-glycerol-phosphate synthase [Betaproteobacteria bacterium]|nr:indole-3-glycerol-phosphate synthase [Betaproteobacteria bacterium]